MMPNHWSLTKQDGSQEQHLCPLRLERNRVVCRCFCCKKSCGLQMFLLQEIVWSADVLVARNRVVCRCSCCKKSCGLQMFLLQEIVWSADVLVTRNRVVCRCSCYKKSCGLQMFLLQEIVWSADVLVARKKACRPEVISRYLACCSSLVCIAEFFVNFVEGDDSP